MSDRGRPSKIDQIIERRDDGSEITAGQKVIELTRTIWRPRKAVAAGAGVTTVTIDNWLKLGGQARERLARREPLSVKDRRYLRFLDQYEKAEGEAIASLQAIVFKAARGGYQRTKTKTTTRDVVLNGVVTTLRTIETTVEEAAPEWTAAMTQLERGLPAEFGRRVAIEGVEGGVPITTREERVNALADEFERYLQGVEDGKRSTIETNGGAHE